VNDTTGMDPVDDHEPGIPLGVKGAGEIGNRGIANARQRSLPLRLHRVLE
jgi:xanthine dehydrogenase YagR molybdenum-binding subunit